LRDSINSVHIAAADSRRQRRAIELGKRPTNSWDYHVELLVVADAKMLHKHRDEQRLRDYVMTLFSTVRSIYRHPSLYASVNIEVVKLIILRDASVTECITITV
jgi:hypothetical protein